jgi:uncharacterized protein (UPF0333 family)
MFRKLIKNKKAQNTAEYAILIALVVAAVIAMQTYAQRAYQDRIRAGGKYLSDQTNSLGNGTQYEPYYLSTNYTIETDSSEFRIIDDTLSGDKTGEDSKTTRKSGGTQTSVYGQYGLTNGI